MLYLWWVVNTSIKIVDIDSARLNLPNERAIPISANHRDMCKFSSANSQRYRPVWEAMQELVERAVKDGQGMSR
jgi:hypothetical protein